MASVVLSGLAAGGALLAGSVGIYVAPTVIREGEVVLARGMNDSHFKLNPIVTLNHQYYLPPVAKSLWRKKVKDGDMVGIKAKTQYPEKPKDWPDKKWEPDCIFGMVKSGLLIGKSVGFLRLKSHAPTPEEIKKNPELANCRRIIDEWMLLEYACCWLPMNQEAIVEQVSKSAVKIPKSVCELLHIDPAEFERSRPAISFMGEGEIHRAIERQMQGLDVEAVVRQAIRDSLDRLTGRV